MVEIEVMAPAHLGRGLMLLAAVASRPRAAAGGGDMVVTYHGALNRSGFTMFLA